MLLFIFLSRQQKIRISTVHSASVYFCLPSLFGHKFNSKRTLRVKRRGRMECCVCAYLVRAHNAFNRFLHSLNTSADRRDCFTIFRRKLFGCCFAHRPAEVNKLPSEKKKTFSLGIGFLEMVLIALSRAHCRNRRPNATATERVRCAWEVRLSSWSVS